MTRLNRASIGVFSCGADAPNATTPLHCRVTRLGLGLGCQFQQLTRGAFDFEPLVRVLHGACVGGCGNGDVPKGLDRPALFGLVDRGDCRSHLLAEALGEECRQVVVDALAARLR